MIGALILIEKLFTHGKNTVKTQNAQNLNIDRISKLKKNLAKCR